MTSPYLMAPVRTLREACRASAVAHGSQTRECVRCGLGELCGRLEQTMRSGALKRPAPPRRLHKRKVRPAARPSR